MAAAKLSRTPSLNGSNSDYRSQSRLSKTQGILLETMQLVAPRKERPVPNHLLESKIYSKVAQNAVVQARPAVLHFGGFEPGKTQRRVLQLANVSTEVQRMHIIPPQSKHFYIKYTKNDRLVPGLTLECVIEFTPDEWRYYYDCIRIHTRGEENLIIPIHAYPIMNTSDFPERVDFPSVPVGHSQIKVIPLRCFAPIDFEFQLTFLQPHPSFTVDPMTGIVPANGEVDVTVRFSPSEFSTACMRLQLVISQFNAKPLVCVFTGISEPGLAKQISEQSAMTEGDLILDPRAISPLDRARKNKRMTLKKTRIASSPDYRPQEIEYQGIKFPMNLDTTHAVAQVLNQEAGKLRIKDLRSAVLSKKGKQATQTRQMKEAMFEMAVRENVYEERQNQLRWQTKLGDNPISQRDKSEILEEREDAWKEYKVRRGDPDETDEQRRSCTNCNFRRTMRDAAQVAPELAKFDTYTNDMWVVRHTALTRFQQAARTIIIRNRADLKIQELRDTLLDWGNKKYTPGANVVSEVEKKREEEATDLKEEDIVLEISKVSSITFPTYLAPNVKDDMAVDALGPVPYKSTEVVVQKNEPYFGLKVPQLYQLQGYTPHNVHDSSLSYYSFKLVRQLRTGAEDEMIKLRPPETPTPDMEVNEGDMRVEEITGSRPASGAMPAAEVKPPPLKPPQALFKPIDYPSLHIFNPAPGLQVFQPPLPYTETDPDFHLCPLPRYTNKDTSNQHMTTQKHYLDREDVVKGVMSWKRFPSQGLTSLANTPTLTNVWVPRWNDSFGDELLPHDVPALYDGLPSEDTDTLDEHEEEEEEGSVKVQLTPEMVNSEFPLIDEAAAASSDDKKKEEMFPHGNKMPATNIPVSAVGPVPREKREQELEYFLKKKYNKLGTKIQGRVDNLNNLKTNPDLILQ